MLVGIDGPDVAGKTTLADVLATALATALAGALPGEVHRASVDDFARPPEERYRRGRLSPEGFRDLARHDSAAEVEHRYRARYLPGQALYRAEADPERAADVLVDNRDPAAPRVLRWGRG